MPVKNENKEKRINKAQLSLHNQHDAIFLLNFIKNTSKNHFKPIKIPKT